METFSKPRIVLMGEPGSGKSTLAKRLAKRLRAKLLEASFEVVYPLAVYARLPRENVLLKNLDYWIRPDAPVVPRHRARETFVQMQNRYAPDIIARILHAKYVDQVPHPKTLVISGLRGLANAEFCRLHNDFVIYLDAPESELIARLQKDRGYSEAQAKQELQEEYALYAARQIRDVANLTVQTFCHPEPECSNANDGEGSERERSINVALDQIVTAIEHAYRMCRRCVNTAKNPAITINAEGYCQICELYLKHFDRARLREELRILKSYRGKTDGPYDVMIGISGGKDSTAALVTLLEMGFRPLAFTFDTGYLPQSTVQRSRQIAKQFDVDYEVIDIRSYLRATDIEAYRKTVELYEQPFALATKRAFQEMYRENRQHYSIKCPHALAFVRTCQICRRMVIRAYVGEAKKRNISAIVLGMNEWTNLSAAQENADFHVSGMRVLNPDAESRVTIFHLPFILQRRSSDTKRILNRVGWTPPPQEDFIESNANSCLFARSTERMAKRLLEFHPDTTRLAREVTVGFITKAQALKALGKIHPYSRTPRQVLEDAGILK